MPRRRLRRLPRATDPLSTRLAPLALVAVAAAAGACRTAAPPAVVVVVARQQPSAPAPRADPAPAAAPAPPRTLDGYWTAERAAEVLARTGTLRIDPDLAQLQPGERRAVAILLRVGARVHRVAEDLRHADALRTREHLAAVVPRDDAERARLDALRRLYDLFGGPLVRLPSGERVAFAPVEPYRPGRNFYPADATREALDALARDPAARAGDVAGERTVVRRRTPENAARDAAALDRHPVLDALHPGLRDVVARGTSSHYAVPYAVAYADDAVANHRDLNAAADAVAAEDPDLSRFFRLRARDLLTDDYEAGDAAWVRGQFRALDAQIGAYETYDDHLLGAKATPSLSVIVRNAARTAELQSALADVQAIEDALPYAPHRRVQPAIPLGAYDVVADFGQARGTNTASILPNDPGIVRRYGRKILLRRNIMESPELFARAQRLWGAVTLPAHHAELTPSGDFDRTLWHELGHYLGPDRDAQGRDLTASLQDAHNLFEELKADLIALWVVPTLVRRGAYDARRARAVYAAGVLRTIVRSPPRRSEAYAAMSLMQQNYLRDAGVLAFDRAAGAYAVRYERFHAAVARMLAEVLALQRGGDRAAADAFVARWMRWDDAVHGVIAARFDGADPRRYWEVRYGALGE